jgi:hypothetical protein
MTTGRNFDDPSGKITKIKFHKVIVAPMHIYGRENWTLKSFKTGKIERAKISEYMLTDHVRDATTRNASQIYTSEERVQDCKNK